MTLPVQLPDLSTAPDWIQQGAAAMQRRYQRYHTIADEMDADAQKYKDVGEHEMARTLRQCAAEKRAAADKAARENSRGLAHWCE